MSNNQNPTVLFDLLARLKTESPGVAEAIVNLREAIQKNSALDSKTANLIAVGIATALKNTDALAGHISMAKDAGAGRDEVISAILLAIPSCGVPAVLAALPVAWHIYA
ncbi:MAG TPA: carboxymuconolactone decarboxylase family protein [Firmicutes bacterium]|nr:carboxymuconolactone decarboxylase family protein [Bacillota bacterium]